MKEIYQQGESDEVFAWTAASNNQTSFAGRLSLDRERDLDRALGRRTPATRRSRTTLDPADPARPVRALGNEHVMGIYFIWKFAQNKPAAKKYLVDQQLAYSSHFLQSKFYNFPAWTNAVKGGFKAMNKLARGGHAQAAAASTRS